MVHVATAVFVLGLDTVATHPMSVVLKLRQEDMGSRLHTKIQKKIK